MFCKNCNVSVLGNPQKCPLCGLPVNDLKIDDEKAETAKNSESATTAGASKNAEVASKTGVADNGPSSFESKEKNFFESSDDILYPKYVIPKFTRIRKTILQIALFTFLSIGFISVLINLFQVTINHTYWSAICIASLIYLYFGFRSFTSRRLYTGAKMLIQLLLLSMVLVVIDVVSGFNRWSVSYVIPFISMTTTILMLILAYSKYYRYKEYMGYIFTSIILGVFPLILALCKVSTVLWPSITVFCVSVEAVFFLFSFADARFKSELTKRFHVN